MMMLMHLGSSRRQICLISERLKKWIPHCIIRSLLVLVLVLVLVLRGGGGASSSFSAPPPFVRRGVVEHLSLSLLSLSLSLSEDQKSSSLCVPLSLFFSLLKSLKRSQVYCLKKRKKKTKKKRKRGTHTKKERDHGERERGLPLFLGQRRTFEKIPHSPPPFFLFFDSSQ